MEERSTYVLRDNNDIGTVQIADDVVAMIASLAVRDIEGVEACAGNMAGELMDKVGIKNARKGAKIDIFENRVKVDVFVFLINDVSQIAFTRAEESETMP